MVSSSAPSFSLLNLTSLPTVPYRLSFFQTNIIKGRVPLASLLNCNKAKSSTCNTFKLPGNYWNYLICEVSAHPPYSTITNHFTRGGALSDTLQSSVLKFVSDMLFQWGLKWNRRINVNLIFIWPLLEQIYTGKQTNKKPHTHPCSNLLNYCSPNKAHDLPAVACVLNTYV